jgi:hypothetical protein
MGMNNTNTATVGADRPVRFGKFGLAEDLTNQHVTMPWKGRTLLGEVVSVAYCETRGVFVLTVRHFNGEDWPVMPIASAIRVISN